MLWILCKIFRQWIQVYASSKFFMWKIWFTEAEWPFETRFRFPATDCRSLSEFIFIVQSILLKIQGANNSKTTTVKKPETHFLYTNHFKVIRFKQKKLNLLKHLPKFEQPVLWIYESIFDKLHHKFNAFIFLIRLEGIFDQTRIFCVSLIVRLQIFIYVQINFVVMIKFLSINSSFRLA